MSTSKPVNDLSLLFNPDITRDLKKKVTENDNSEEVLNILHSYSKTKKSKGYTPRGTKSQSRGRNANEAHKTKTGNYFETHPNTSNTETCEKMQMDESPNSGCFKVSDKFKCDMEEHLRSTKAAGYPINITEPDMYTQDVKNAKKGFDRALLNRGLEIMPEITRAQLDKIGNQSILITEECSQIGNVIHENKHQMQTQKNLGLLVNSFRKERNANTHENTTVDDSNTPDSPITSNDENLESLRTLKLNEWEKNIMDAFNKANEDVFYAKESQINTILESKKNNHSRFGNLEEIKNDLLSPLDGEREYSINIPTIKRAYIQNFYRPAIPKTGERSCRNGQMCKVFQIYYQLLLSSKRHLIENKWKNDAPIQNKTNFNQQGPAPGSDLCQDYKFYANKYKKTSDNIDADKLLPKPEPLREFITPGESKRRSESLARELAIFSNEMNANYRDRMSYCRNRGERLALKAKMKKQIEDYVASVDSKIANGPPNCCILCELSETARLARNCSNNSPIHNPELNIVTQKFANIFNDVGEYDSNCQFTCGGNFHGITKPILDFNVNNYLPSRCVVAHSKIEISFADDKSPMSNFFTFKMENILHPVNSWSEREGMLYTIEDSILNRTDSM